MNVCATSTTTYCSVWRCGSTTTFTTLPNYHMSAFLDKEEGVLHRKKGADGKRELEHMLVKCLEQNKTYSLTFQQIDKSNAKEAQYDLRGQSKKHNWSPKLVLHFLNMNNSNAYSYYKCLVELYTPNRGSMGTKEATQEMIHAFCQQGAPMRVQKAEHPLWFCDLTKVFNSSVD